MRDEIIQTARVRHQCAGGRVEHGRNKWVDVGELAAAIDIIAAHGRADEQTSDRKLGHHGARIGRYVVWSDADKIAVLQTFASELAAVENA